MNKNYLIIGKNSSLGGYFEERMFKEEKRVYGLAVEPGHPYWGYPKEFLKNQIQKYYPDVIINFTGAKTNDFEESLQGNVIITKNIFDAIIECGSNAKLILIGSASEYGEQNEYVEEVNERPVSIYGLTKLMQKELFKYYFVNSMVNTCYIRPFNILYEKINDEKLFIGSFNNQIQNAIKDKTKKIVFGNLDSYRDYLMIDDLYEAFFKVIENGKSGEIYNIGYGKPLHLKTFVKEVSEMFGFELIEENHSVESFGGIKNTVVSKTDKICNLGWNPKYKLEDFSGEYYKRLKITHESGE